MANELYAATETSFACGGCRGRSWWTASSFGHVSLDEGAQAQTFAELAYLKSSSQPARSNGTKRNSSTINSAAF